jgi:Uma2 family endonuclease
MTMERIQRRPLRMSEDQFFAWAEAQEERYELLEGEVVMQAGATRAHERVAKRIFALLYAQVDETAFDVNKGAFGVRIRPGSERGSILYPDVLVDRQSTAGDEQSTMQPIVVIEVLSRSTDYEHHVQKLASYKKRDSFCQYVVFDQNAPRAFVWTKGAKGWPEKPETIEDADSVVALPPIDAQLRLAEIYRP